MMNSNNPSKLYFSDENGELKELGTAELIGIDVGDGEDYSVIRESIISPSPASFTCKIPKIKKWYRRKKGKRYLPYYKYVETTKNDIFKRFFGVSEKELLEVEIHHLVPSVILNEIKEDIISLPTAKSN